MAQSVTEGHLKGIVAGACRQLGISPKPFRTKPGGELFKGNADEFYVPLQNVPGAINTKSAIEGGLVKRCFCILKDEKNGQPAVLKITEWTADQDKGSRSYRTIWETQDTPAARMEMMHKFMDSYRELIE